MGEDTIPPPSPEAPPAIVPNQNETIPLPSLGAPPAFDRNILYDNMNYQAIEFKDLIRKMGLERRRDVAFAFFNTLELIRNGKITGEQDEFFGPLMVKTV